MLNLKIRSHALVMAIVISLVISGVAAFMIWLHATQLSIAEKKLMEIRLKENIKSGFLLAEAENRVMAITDPPMITSLFSNAEDSVQYKRSIWGVYYMTFCKASFKEISYHRAALYGEQMNKNLFALYLADHKRPVSICGKSSLQGKCFIPASGIKAAVVDRIPFSGRKPDEENLAPSSEQLPPVNKKIEDTNLSILQNVLNERGAIIEQSVPMAKSNQEDSIFRSFSQTTWFYKLPDNFGLKNISVKGNIVLVSKGTVTIYENAKLEDVLIYARKIIVKSGFRGSLQAFASDSIIVEAHVKLDYPSALMLLPFEEKKITPAIVTGTYVKLDGLIYASHFFSAKAPFVLLEKKSKVRGLTYVNGYFTHKGNIEGTLICDILMLRQPSGTYENYLMDGEISSLSIPSFFVNSPMCPLSDAMQIVKWLN